MANLHDNLKTNMAAIVNKAYWFHTLEGNLSKRRKKALHVPFV